MRHQRQCFIAFLCLGVAFISSASRREELERAAELAVEQAAERAAERAVEKALNSGNITTESKIIREFYSSVRKDPRKERKKYDDYDRYKPLNDEESEEDVDDWSTYSRRGKSRFDPQDMKSRSFRQGFSRIDFKNTSNSKRRFPRSKWSREIIL
ncbi:uncharacterized protein LOC126852116 [Cataglyphis hispanica]|uniref:uncharacterized protein LOC126852116 n=1 Tax=Cataglyphis hispanica TaxID=1086592 RepID=UPI00217F9ED6|nr:uncharacterized protein LOC126852116 [Cataglyphis hispanica]